METTFKEDRSMFGFVYKIAEDVHVDVNFRENTIKLLYSNIIKEEHTCDDFTIESFFKWIYNLQIQFSN